MTAHDDLTDDAPTTVPWLLIIAYFALIAVAGLIIGDPGDKTADCRFPTVSVSGSGSGFPASPVEPDPDCSQEVGR